MNNEQLLDLLGSFIESMKFERDSNLEMFEEFGNEFYHGRQRASEYAIYMIIRHLELAKRGDIAEQLIKDLALHRFLD